MATRIFLGYPPSTIKEWIKTNHIKPEEDSLKTPLTFTAENTGATLRLVSSDGPAVTLETLCLGKNDDWTEFSDDDWQPYNVGDEITLKNAGDKVMFRNSSDNIQVMATDPSNYNFFEATTGDVAASGNIMFLMDKTGELRDLSKYPWCFYAVFAFCSVLTQAPALPATTLADCCYHSMFAYCSYLTQAPVLPATTLVTGCYSGMFGDCASLTNAYFPNLDSNTVINEVVGNQYAFDYAANDIETQCSDRTIFINSTEA